MKGNDRKTVSFFPQTVHGMKGMAIASGRGSCKKESREDRLTQDKSFCREVSAFMPSIPAKRAAV